MLSMRSKILLPKNELELFVRISLQTVVQELQLAQELHLGSPLMISESISVELARKFQLMSQGRLFFFLLEASYIRCKHAACVVKTNFVLGMRQD